MQSHIVCFEANRSFFTAYTYMKRAFMIIRNFVFYFNVLSMLWICLLHHIHINHGIRTMTCMPKEMCNKYNELFASLNVRSEWIVLLGLLLSLSLFMCDLWFSICSVIVYVILFTIMLFVVVVHACVCVCLASFDLRKRKEEKKNYNELILRLMSSTD